MTLIKQALLGLAATAIAIGLWAFFVPGAAPVLDRLGIYAALGLDAPDAGGGSGGRAGFSGGATRVAVATVEDGRIDDRVSAIGDGRAVRTVTVRSEATGSIRSLSIAPGSFVEAGAPIVQLGDEAERIALERARLTVDDAAANLQRLQRLSGSGAVSTVQLREAELAFRSAELEVDQAEFDLAQRRIDAPISGWVGLLDVAVGDRLSAQDPVATIADRSSILIDFRVPERHIAALRTGMPVEVIALARPGETLVGEIVALDNTVDRTSRTLAVQAAVANADDSLRAGQAFEVRLSFAGERMPAVDPLAIQWSSAGSFVWRVEDDAAVRVPIVIRQRTSDRVLVEGALSPGDAIVVEGVQTLRPGATVEIVAPAGRTGEADALGDTTASRPAPPTNTL